MTDQELLHITLDNRVTEIYSLPLPDNVGHTGRREAETGVTAALIRHIFGPKAILSHHANGAPYVADCHQFISVSHGGGRVVVGVDPRGPIGVDIEQWREALLNVAGKILTPHEREIFNSLPEDDATRRKWLLQAWTAKEALFKTGATGADVISLIDTTALPPGYVLTRLDYDEDTLIAVAALK